MNNSILKELLAKEDYQELTQSKSQYCDSLIELYYTLPDSKEKRELRTEINQLSEELNG